MHPTDPPTPETRPEGRHGPRTESVPVPPPPPLPAPSAEAPPTRPEDSGEPPVPPPLPTTPEPSAPTTWWAIDTAAARRAARSVAPPSDEAAAELPFDDDALQALARAGLLPAWVHDALADEGQTPAVALVRERERLEDVLRATEGRDLEARLPVLDLFARVAEAVAPAHAAGVVHRALRPEAVVVGRDDEVVVVDWELATTTDAEEGADDAWTRRVASYREALDLRAATHVLGSPAYVPPEAWADDLAPSTPAWDVYALGVILHRILTGWEPFTFQTLDELREKTSAGDAPSVRDLDPDVPAELADLCALCLSRSPTERPADAGEVATAVRSWSAAEAAKSREEERRALLAQALTLRPRAAAPATPAGPEPHRRNALRRETRRERRKLKAALMLLLGAAIASGVWAIGTASRERPRSSAWESGRRAVPRTPPGVPYVRDDVTPEALFYEEQGRKEWLAGRPDAAAAFLAEAYDSQGARPSLRFLLARACGPIDAPPQVLQGHGRAVVSLAFSIDGRRLVTASRDGTARVWHLDTARHVTLAGHTDAVRAAAFDPAGARVATASADGTACLWDAETGALLHRLQGHSAKVVDVVFSPGGTLLATASTDGSARLWDAATGVPRMTLQAHASPLHTVRFHPSGKRLLTVASDLRPALWDVQNGALVRRFLGHDAAVRAAAFSPDGKWIVTAGDDRVATLWDVETGHTHRALDGHREAVTDVRFSADGVRLATASDDGSVRVWDVRTLGLLALLEPVDDGGPVEQTCFDPRGAFLATTGADGAVRVWDVARAHLLAAFHSGKGRVHTVAFSPDGARLASGRANGGVELWDVGLETRGAAEVRGWVAENVPWRVHDDRLVRVAVPGGRPGADVSSPAADDTGTHPASSSSVPGPASSMELDDTCHALGLTVQLEAAGVVAVGQTFTLVARARNAADVPLSNVTLAMRKPRGVEAVGQPKWVVLQERLGPGDVLVLENVFAATDAGELTFRTNAREERGWAAASATAVVSARSPGDPALERPERTEAVHSTRRLGVVCRVEPQIVLVGETLTATARVTNVGDEGLADLTLALRGGEGLELVGDGGLASTIDELEPGESRDLRVEFRAERTGDVRVDASARQKAGWAAAGSFCGVLVQGLSALQMRVVDEPVERPARGWVEVGEEVRLAAVVRNDGGSAPTQDLEVVWRLPSYLEFVSGVGDREIDVTGTGRRASSETFVLAPYESRRFEVTARAVARPVHGFGRVLVEVVDADGATLLSRVLSTTIAPEGSTDAHAVLDVQMVDASTDGDDEGVFEEGQTFLYVLTVSNERGEAALPEASVTWKLPPEFTFAAGTGDLGATLESDGPLVRSTPFTLGPGQVQRFELLVRCAKADAGRMVHTSMSLQTTEGVGLALADESTTIRPPRPR